MDDFFVQAKKGKLPPVVYIDPAFSANDDHPPHHTMLGQQLIASVYTALATSPQWKNILFVLTYDEHGGYFDHVSPPNAPDEQVAAGFGMPIGFRVPGLVMGPYAKQGQVISTPYDHTSVLKHLQNMFDLDPLTMRSTAANPLDDCIDQERLTKGTPNDPASIPAVEVNESDITMNCMAAAAVKSDHIMLQIADANPKLFGELDRRKYVKDYLYLIGDYLEEHNMGRIIRGK
jgi:phospholipase C